MVSVALVLRPMTNGELATATLRAVWSAPNCPVRVQLASFVDESVEGDICE
jgi:hypothetical protein